MMGIGAILLLIAMALFLYNVQENKKAEKSANDVLEEMEAQLTNASNQDVNENRSSDLSNEEGFRDDLDSGSTNDSRQNGKTVMQYKNIVYMGKLTFPTFHMSLPVIDEWSYPNLKKAPCRYTGSAEEGNLVICAHNYKSHFGILKNLKIGDTVYFTDMDGYVYEYEVAGSEVLQPTAVEDMTTSGFELSLFTCTYGGKTRLAVRLMRKEYE